MSDGFYIEIGVDILQRIIRLMHKCLIPGKANSFFVPAGCLSIDDISKLEEELDRLRIAEWNAFFIEDDGFIIIHIE